MPPMPRSSPAIRPRPAPAGPPAGAQAPAQAAPVAVAPLRVLDPVVIGPKAAGYARQQPVTVRAGALTVGVSPTVAAGYLHTVTQRVTGSLGSVAGIGQEKSP